MKTLVLTDEEFRVLSMVVQDAHSAPDVLRWNADELDAGGVWRNGIRHWEGEEARAAAAEEAERNNDVLQTLLAKHFCSDSPYTR